MLRHARRIKSKGYTKKERYCFYFGFWWGQEHKFESFPQLIDAVSEALGKGEYDGLSSINTK